MSSSGAKGLIKHTENFYFYSAENSVVGIATPYVLDGPGFKNPSGQNFPNRSRPCMGSTQPLYTIGTGFLPKQ